MQEGKLLFRRAFKLEVESMRDSHRCIDADLKGIGEPDSQGNWLSGIGESPNNWA